MTRSPNALEELLAGKTPEAMYDALHARRCLSAWALQRPTELVEFIKAFMRTFRQRTSMPPSQIKRLVKALAVSEFLNEEGIRLCGEETLPD